MSLNEKFDNRALRQGENVEQFLRAEDWNAVIKHVRGYINVQEPPYNAVGDGVTDDTAALAAWAAAMPASGAHMVLPPGVYIVTANTSISGKSNFRINGRGATIKYKDATAVSSGKFILEFVNCQDGVIEGLTLDGNRSNRTPAEVPAHNLHVTTSSARLVFREVRSIGAVVDGLYLDTGTPATLSTYPTDISFLDCESSDSWRNNASLVASVRTVIRGGAYFNAFGGVGGAGIDVEADAGTTHSNRDTVIEGVKVYGNSGTGISIGGAVANVRTVVRDAWLSGNATTAGAAILVGLSTAPLIDGVVIEDHPATLTRGLIDVNANASTGVVIRNVEVRDATTPTGAGQYALYVHSTVTGPVSLDNIRLRNVGANGIQLGPQAFVSRISADTVTGTGLVMNGAGSRASDVLLRATGGITLQVMGDDSELDNARVIDPPGTTAAVLFQGARPIARNITVLQTSSVPVGQKAIWFNTVAPLVAQNLIARSAGTDYTSANGVVFGSGIGTTALTAAGRFVGTVSADRGDTSQTITVGDAQEQRWDTDLTANRTVTLSATGATSGDRFRIVRTGLGAFTLTVQDAVPTTIKVIPSATAAFVDVVYDGTEWWISGYGAL